MSGTTARHRGQRPRRATALPGASRRVTIVHSDIVGSTGLVAAAGPRYPDLLARHRRLIATAVARRGGSFLSHAGDGTLAIFEEPADALDAESTPSGRSARRRGPRAWRPGCAWASTQARSTTWPTASRSAWRSTTAPGSWTWPPPGRSSCPRRSSRRCRPAADRGWSGAGHHEVRDHRDPVRLHQVAADGVTVVVPRETHAPVLSSVA